jgi:hypothetical protein
LVPVRKSFSVPVRKSFLVPVSVRKSFLGPVSVRKSFLVPVSVREKFGPREKKFQFPVTVSAGPGPLCLSLGKYLKIEIYSCQLIDHLK